LRGRRTEDVVIPRSNRRLRFCAEEEQKDVVIPRSNSLDAERMRSARKSLPPLPYFIAAVARSNMPEYQAMVMP
jgi:hypothetical protein